MNGRSEIDSRDGQGGHAGHSFWAMLACCAPLILIFTLIALKVI